jgi:hypothetical protein
MNTSFRYFIFSLLFTLIVACKKNESFSIESEGQLLEVEKVADSISVPFGMAFLPDGSCW